MSYFTGDQIARIRAEARLRTRDGMESFLHSMLFFACQTENADLVAEVKPANVRDGAFRGLIMINEFAELLSIALDERLYDGDKGR